MNNPRITAKDRGLIKAAFRRAFSRSALRKQVIEASIVPHVDLSRPRVKSWGLCQECKTPTPKSYLIVDHIAPVIPLDKSFEEMTLDEVADRMWCWANNLQALCQICHLTKTKEENKIRKSYKNNKRDK